MTQNKFEGTVDIERLKKIAGTGGDIQPRSTPTVVIPLATPEITAISALSLGVSSFITKFRSCGKGFCK